MNTNKEELTFLEKLVAFQTVSTDIKRVREFKLAQRFLLNFLKKLGFQTKIIGKPHSLIIAQKMISSQRPTIGVYAHYDVQPEGNLNEWHSKPFALTIKQGKIFGRGTADDKGQLVQNLFAVKKLLQTNKLKNNIVFIFEGEEELGSPNLEKYLLSVKDLLKQIDVFLLTDVGMFDRYTPAIYYALRGLVYFELEIWTGKTELHSGVYGNLAANPAQILADLFSKMKTKIGRVAISGFYQRVRKLTAAEKRMLAQAKKSNKELLKEMQAFVLEPVDKKYPYLSPKIYPSLDINGIYAGFIEKGSKTIIPNYALAKFSCRLVEYQEPKKIVSLIHKFVKDNLPRGVRYQLKVLSSARPFFVDYRNPVVQKVVSVLNNHFPKKCVFNREGGTIPCAEILDRLFKKPVILTGFTLPDCNMHAPNENMDLQMFFKGIEVLQDIYSLDF